MPNIIDFGVAYIFKVLFFLFMFITGYLKLGYDD